MPFFQRLYIKAKAKRMLEDLIIILGWDWRTFSKPRFFKNTKLDFQTTTTSPLGSIDLLHVGPSSGGVRFKKQEWLWVIVGRKIAFSRSSGYHS